MKQNKDKDLIKEITDSAAIINKLNQYIDEN